MFRLRLSPRPELFSYVVVWLLLLLAPLLTEWLSVYSGTSDVMAWERVLRSWSHLGALLLLFLVHDLVLAPLLVYDGRRVAYLAGVAAVVVLFTYYECSNRPDHRPGGPAMPRRQELPAEPGTQPSGPHGGEDAAPGLRGDFEAAPANTPATRPGDGAGPRGDFEAAPGSTPATRPGDGAGLRGDFRPPRPSGEREVVTVILAVLMLGMNLGLKYYFRHQADARRLRELERQNLEQRLAYLRHQVNPHFLMNTLNNIHALIDIDAESAQTAVVELSRLLRYAIYDAERPAVALQKEVDFLNNYLELMRMRYSDSVDIRLDVPAPVPAGSVPPLLFVSFVENAFKHGVSYRQASFVHVAFRQAEGRLLFTCCNSLPAAAAAAAVPAAEPGGLGLRNVRQRLELLFPGDYHLDFRQTERGYIVLLDIPLNFIPADSSA